jgi:hypothetical protein
MTLVVQQLVSSDSERHTVSHLQGGGSCILYLIHFVVL